MIERTKKQKNKGALSLPFTRGWLVSRIPSTCKSKKLSDIDEMRQI